MFNRNNKALVERRTAREGWVAYCADTLYCTSCNGRGNKLTPVGEEPLLALDLLEGNLVSGIKPPGDCNSQPN